ncbi:hypothetical protein [Mucilaginibacter segetis]|uniref:SGNH domain-containing protein n=1 Tax=Mucilaginibacter segetis TaxID=2793071 RepID=A0A934PX79_9SPHI|nr:hypothetical protein [Mucilaginibacter segetis]MBK0380810.1 hypothetical protein [Mucilaginibacter segetis]
MNDLKTYADKHHFKVYFSYPSLDYAVYSSNVVATLNRVNRDFNQQMKIKQLDGPSDMIFADSLFYDTEYHLTPDGKKICTKKLLDRMRAEKIVQ